uniref:Uncharacterized protein n=1 Tax=viral metagenome TaxID=1070528 RepID=A0A6C0BNK2_9ZZZZ
MSTRPSEYGALPTEVLYNISQYGIAPPTLNPQYIVEEVQLIDSNFPWASELMREYLKFTQSQDSLYNVMSDTFKVLGRYSGVINTIDLMRTIDVRNDNFVPTNELNPSGDVTMTVSMPHTNDVVKQIRRRGVSYNDNNIYIELPRGSNKVDVVNALYLCSTVRTPQSLGLRGSAHTGNGTFNSNRTYDYAQLINNVRNEDLPSVLPEIFRTIPSDTEVVTELLRINPKYDFGNTLAWIRTRSETCERVRSDARLLAMYDLLVNDSLAITRVDITPDGIIRDMDISITADPGEYLRLLGIPGDAYSVDVGDLNRLLIDYDGQQLSYWVSRIYSDFVTARACIAYNPIGYW